MCSLIQIKLDLHKLSRKLKSTKIPFSQFSNKEIDYLIETSFEIEEEQDLEEKVDGSRWWKK